MSKVIKKVTNILKIKKAQIIILLLITFLIYANTLQNGFAWDDQTFLLNWPSIKDNRELSAVFSVTTLLTGDLPFNHRGVYRPLRSIFYILSFKAWGTNPLGYHAQALIIHLAAVLLIYLITCLIVKKNFMPFMTAILFSTHPIHTEGISFITASFDTIGVVFLLLSFYLYLRAQIIKERVKSHYIASYIYTVFAFFTYEMTLVLPLLIVLYDLCFKKLTFKNWRTRLKVYAPFFMLLLVYGIIRFFLLRVGNRADYLGIDFLRVAVMSRIEAPEILLHYFSWLIFPVKLTILHEVPHTLTSGFIAIVNYFKVSISITESFFRISIIIPILAIATGILLSLKIFSKKKEVAFALSWILVSLLTVSNILPQGAAWAERFLYLPSYGFSLLTAYLYYILYSFLIKTRLKKFSIYFLIILFTANIVFYSLITFLRNKDWTNNITLYSSALRLAPNNDTMLNGIGISYIWEDKNKIDLAIESFKKAVSVNPSNADSLNNLAQAYTIKGNFTLALDTYKKALKAAPNYFQTHMLLANFYLQQNQNDLALKEYQAAIKINPNSDWAHHVLGVYYSKQKKYNLAIKEYQSALAINPNRSQTLNNMGTAYMQTNQYELAIKTFQTALEINTTDADIYLNLAEAYEKQGDLNLAVVEYKKALQISPDNNKAKAKLKALTRN